MSTPENEDNELDLEAAVNQTQKVLGSFIDALVTIGILVNAHEVTELTNEEFTDRIRILTDVLDELKIDKSRFMLEAMTRHDLPIIIH